MAPSASNSTSIPLVRSEPDGFVWSAFMGIPPLLTNRTFDLSTGTRCCRQYSRLGCALGASARHRRVTLLHQPLARHAAIPNSLADARQSDGAEGTPVGQISLLVRSH